MICMNPKCILLNEKLNNVFDFIYMTFQKTKV